MMQKGGGKPALGSRKGAQTIPEVTLQLSATGHLGSAGARQGTEDQAQHPLPVPASQHRWHQGPGKAPDLQ